MRANCAKFNIWHTSCREKVLIRVWNIFGNYFSNLDTMPFFNLCSVSFVFKCRT